MNARAGYWDVERCAWVGVEPMHVVPPVGAPVGTAADAQAVPTPRDAAHDVPSSPSTPTAG